MSSADYWVAVDTVMPVLALALVVEARSTAATWHEQHPGVRRGQSLLFFVVISALALGENAGLTALLRDAKADGWMPVALNTTIAGAMSLLALNPAFAFLFQGNAEVFGRILTVPLRSRAQLVWRRLLFRRRATAATSLVVEQISVIDKVLADIRAQRSQIEAQLATSSTTWQAERPWLADLDQMEQIAREHRHRLQNMGEEHRRNSEEAATAFEEWRHAVDASRGYRQELMTRLLRNDITKLSLARPEEDESTAS